MTDEFDITVDSHEDSDGSSSTLYANETKATEKGKSLYSKRGDSADEIDPRKLVRDPTISEIRWYYRRTFAKKLVNKPIDDAFKNGFTIEGPGSSRANRFLDSVDYIEEYKIAEKKARRDGFSLLFIGTRESGSEGVWQSPLDEEVQVTDITHVKTLTIDDLCQCGPADLADQVDTSYDIDQNNIHIRETGIVISTDINDPNYRQPIGYALRTPDGARFVHKDRVQHLVWNPEVDGDYHADGNSLGIARYDEDSRALGRWEGDSILIPSYDLLKGITKGNWSLTQAIYRNAANMYVVHLPRDANEDDRASAENEFRNMNAKSEFIVPGGPPGSDPDTYEVVQYTSGDMLEPGQHYEVLFDQICASNEMTKSVLFGTQSGTVSGSETDIKNYFNKVERYRRNRAENKIREFTSRAASMIDGRTGEDFTLEYDFEWGPLFRVSKKDRVAMIQSFIQGLGTAINGYMLTPDEARSILSEQWSEFEDLGPLTDEDKDMLDRINLFQVGRGLLGQMEEEELGELGNGSPGSQSNRLPGNNNGGMSQGQQTGQFADDQMEKPTTYEEA